VVGAYRIDEAAEVGTVTDDAGSRRRTEREVDCALEAIADASAAKVIDVGFDRAFGGVELGLVGDVADRAADRPCAEERALRPAKGLDTVEVKKIEVGREQ